MTTGSTQISNENYHADSAISASMQKLTGTLFLILTGQNINQQVQ